MLDRLIHKWLGMPYMLHMEVVRRPKKPRATFLLIHGLGSSSKVWDKIADQFPHDVRVITVDLLGFGKSPRPAWLEYDAKLQARSVMFTYRFHGYRYRATVVGHSMGGIVAVEIAKHYPKITRSLILCSPPFYKLESLKPDKQSKREKILLDIYGTIHRHPERFAKVASVAIKYKLIDDSYRLEKETLPSYINALQAAIVNQTALRDALGLTLPVDIIHGSRDPVVVRANLKYLARLSPTTILTHVRAGHEINRVMANMLIAKMKVHANYKNTAP